MVAGDVIDRTRTRIRDDAEPYRWSNVNLLGYLGETFRELWNRRPDLFLNNEGALLAVPNPNSVEQSLNPVFEGLIETLSLGVAARALGEDLDSEGAAERATNYREQFIDSLI